MPYSMKAGQEFEETMSPLHVLTFELVGQNSFSLFFLIVVIDRYVPTHALIKPNPTSVLCLYRSEFR